MAVVGAAAALVGPLFVAVSINLERILRRETAETLAMPLPGREPPQDALDRVRKETSRLGRQSPEIPARPWSQVTATHEIQTVPPARRSEVG